MLLLHLIRFLITSVGAILLLEISTRTGSQKGLLGFLICTVVSGVQFLILMRFLGGLRYVQGKGWCLSRSERLLGFYGIRPRDFYRAIARDEFAVSTEYRHDQGDYRNLLSCIQLARELSP